MYVFSFRLYGQYLGVHNDVIHWLLHSGDDQVSRACTYKPTPNPSQYSPVSLSHKCQPVRCLTYPPEEMAPKTTYVVGVRSCSFVLQPRIYSHQSRIDGWRWDRARYSRRVDVFQIANTSVAIQLSEILTGIPVKTSLDKTWLKQVKSLKPCSIPSPVNSRQIIPRIVD